MAVARLLASGDGEKTSACPFETDLKVGQSVEVGAAMLKSCDPTRTDNASTCNEANRAATAKAAASKAFNPFSGSTWPQPPGNLITTEEDEVTGTLASRLANAKASNTFSSAAWTVLAPPKKASEAAEKKTKTTGGSPPLPGFVSLEGVSTDRLPKNAVAAAEPVSNSIKA